MISKADIKLIRSLSQKKFRDSEGLFVVEGEKMVQEAIDSTFKVVTIYRTDDIGEEAMSRISMLATPSPALAIVRKPSENNGYGTKGLSLALDSLRDPGNMGTILRLADWFGIENIFASPDCVDIFNPKTVQASMGAIFRKQVTYINLQQVIPTYSDSGIPVYGTFLDGDNIYSKKLSRENALIVMGSENNGISEAVGKLVTERILIPPYPDNAHTSESLNVAIATAIVCAEFRRVL